MITPGLETLIQPQLNDPVIDQISNFYPKLKKLEKQYRVKRSISKKDYTASLDKLKKEFDDIIYNRFNFHMEIKPSFTFATFPIHNTDKISGAIAFEELLKDSKKAEQQAKEFAKYIKNHQIIIDRKRAKFVNLKDSWVITLYYTSDWFDMIDGREFTAILLHEIGHVFTLIEMYNLTNKQVYSLLEAFLTIDPEKTLADKLAISKKKSDNIDKDVTLELYDSLSGNLKSIILAPGREKDETDSEFQADDFVAKFGLSGELTASLAKLIDVGYNSLDRFPLIIISNIILNTLLYVTLYMAIFSITFTLSNVLALMIGVALNTIITGIIFFLLRMVISVTKRNPIGDEHGTILDRFSNIKYGIIAMIRTYKFDKNQTKLLLKQLDITESNIKLVEKSIYNSALGTLISKFFIPNLNIRDELANALDSLINNDLYAKQARFKVGLENSIGNIKPNVYLQAKNLFSRWLKNIFSTSDSKSFRELNKALEPYGIYIEYTSEKKLLVKSLNDIDINLGMTTIAFVPKEMSDSILTLTLDIVKIQYMLMNPYIEVYNIQKIKMLDHKYFYLVEVERFRPISRTRDKVAYRLAKDVNEYLEDLYNNYGEYTLDEILDALMKSNIDNIGLIKPQLEVIKKINDEQNDNYKIFFDLHSGNIMMNKDDEIVITDPIYYTPTLALKVDNNMDLSKYESYLNDK